jgi:hypothetical protein
VIVEYLLLFACADVSTIMIVKPGHVVDVLLANQKVDHPSQTKFSHVKLAMRPSDILVIPMSLPVPFISS